MKFLKRGYPQRNSNKQLTLDMHKENKKEKGLAMQVPFPLAWHEEFRTHTSPAASWHGDACFIKVFALFAMLRTSLTLIITPTKKDS